MRRGRNRRSHVPLRHHKFRGRRLSSDRPRRFPAANHARITRTSCRAHLLCRPRHRRSRLRQQNDAASRHLGVANHSLSGSARCHTRRRISPRRLCRRSREAKRQSLRTALCVDRRALAQAPHRNGSLPARFACACSVVILISPLHLCTVSASRLISSPLSSSASIHPSIATFPHTIETLFYIQYLRMWPYRAAKHSYTSTTIYLSHSRPNTCRSLLSFLERAHIPPRVLCSAACCV